MSTHLAGHSDELIIDRHPVVARRLHEAERLVRTATDEETMRSAAREVAGIKEAARRAVIRAGEVAQATSP
ncbi:hypothetical protein CTZ27_06560 [Streptomyces griseocarneus]|nr:hypothetical protein CTZ27_06560 [Streptomyces griseocarneus]